MIQEKTRPVTDGILIGISSLNIGGAEKQAIEDANMLSGRYRVVLLSFAVGPMKSLLSEEVKLVIRSEKGYFRRIKAILDLIRQHDIHVMHAHLYAPMVLMGWAGFITGRPVIWNFHSHAYENSFKARTLHKVSSRLSSVRKILFPAKELITYYEQEGYAFSRNKVMVAYNSGQDHSRPVSVTPEKQPGILNVVYVGRLVALKQVEFLVELAHWLPTRTEQKFSIEIVGDGPELQSIRELASRLEVGDSVRFRGFQGDTLSWYRFADIFILPSREEVLSLSLIDAGLAGKPSIAMHTGGNEDIIEDTITGFLVSSKEELFEKALVLLTNSTIRETMGREAAVVCERKFSISARRRLLETIYEKVV